MKVIIMAGGKGKRISSIAPNIPKSMINVNGKPILEYAIENLRKQGFRDIILTVGYLGDVVMEYFGDGSGISPATGKPFNVRITYYFEKELLGNAGALFRIRDQLKRDFLLLNGDLIFDVDLWRFVNFHRRKGGLVTLFTHPNNHPYDSGLILADNDGAVLEWISKEEKHPIYYKNRVNAGIHIVSPCVLDIVRCKGKVDLDRQILKPLAGTGKMFCYDSPEYVSDMGTPERYRQVCMDMREGRPFVRNLKNKQRAVFLDRDGTINRYVGFLRDINEFELIDGVAEAIKKINLSGHLVIVVTNQPVIARGEITRDELRRIHDKMETLLGNAGAYVDAVYYCPHHPHGGFPGEISELKIECKCRKPKPGMLEYAAEKFNIDLQQSWMVGDGENDILAGKAAGCKTALISTECRKYGQTVTAVSLLQFVNRYMDYGGAEDEE